MNKHKDVRQGFVFGRDMLGYDVRDGKLYINKEGAETVRLIFHKFLNESKETHIIAEKLQDSEIKTSTNMKIIRQASNTQNQVCNRLGQAQKKMLYSKAVSDIK